MAVTERWLPVIGWEGYYEVSDLGRVKSLARTIPDSLVGSKRLKERILKPTGALYLQVKLARFGQKHQRRVHWLVLESFVGPRPDGMEGRHLDGNPKNAALSNLEYGTPSQNQRDRIDHGTDDRGERSVSAKLTASDVLKIRELRGVLSQQSIALRFGVSRALVRAVLDRRQWSWLQQPTEGDRQCH